MADMTTDVQLEDLSSGPGINPFAGVDFSHSKNHCESRGRSWTFS